MRWSNTRKNTFEEEKKKAGRLRDFGDLRLEDVPARDWIWLGFGQSQGIQPSVTDVEIFKGVNLARRATFDKLIKEGKPIQRGHEFCGEVVEVAKDVTTRKIIGFPSSPPLPSTAPHDYPQGS